MNITWVMPEVPAGAKRSQIEPCRVSFGDDVNVATLASALLEASILSVESTTGLGAVVAMLRASKSLPLLAPDKIEHEVSSFLQRGELVVDYWGGWPVKLACRLIGDQPATCLEISVNWWIDRQMCGCDIPAAVQELEKVLQVVKSM